MGILFGAVLTHHTKDEVLEIKKAIPFLQFAVLVAVFLILYFFFPFEIVTILLVLSFGFIYFFWHKNNFNFLDYIVLSMVLVISSINPKAHIYVTFFVFIFGVLSGSLFYVLNIKHKTKKTSKLAHHKHSGNNFSMSKITSKLFYTYKFFFFLSIVAFLTARIINLFV